MRLVEFADDDIIEDEAVARGDSDLLNTLIYLQGQAAGKHLVPRVRVDSLIDMINMHNNPSGIPFNNKALEDAYKTNSEVKELIDDIREDEATGYKYVYLTNLEAEPSFGDGTGDVGASTDAGPSDNEKIVSQMASKAR